MRGQVLGVDRASGYGQISGDDGQRYRFRPEDWADRTGPVVGAAVDFEARDGRAGTIYRLPGSFVAPPAPVSDRNKLVAAVLAFFLGVLGVHRFYLGRIGSGVVMLVLSLTVVGLFVTGLWAFVDFLRYLVMSDADFARRYARG